MINLIDYIKKHINNKRVRYLLKEETKQLLKEIL